MLQGLHGVASFHHTTGQSRPPDWKPSIGGLPPPAGSTKLSNPSHSHISIFPRSSGTQHFLSNPQHSPLSSTWIATSSVAGGEPAVAVELPWMPIEPWLSWNSTLEEFERAGNSERIQTINNTKNAFANATAFSQSNGHERGNAISISMNKASDHGHTINVIDNKDPVVHVNKEQMVCNIDMTIKPVDITVSFEKEGFCQSQKANSTLEEEYTVQGMLSMEDFLSDDSLLLIDTYVSIMQVCRARKDPALTLKVLHKSCSMGIDSVPNFVNYMVPMFVDCKLIHSAERVSSKAMLSMNEYSWTSLINGYLQSGQSLQAFIGLEKMQAACIHPSSYTLVILVNFCAELLDIERGWKMHAEAVMEEFEGDLFVGNALIDMYGKCSSCLDAQEVFSTMLDHDIISWNTLIAGYAHCGCSQEAFSCIHLMRGEGLLPDATTLSSLLKACSIEDAAENGRRLHAHATNKGFDSELLLATALIDMYAKASLLSEAQYVFDKLEYRDIVSWTALISGYADHRPGEEAIQCYKRMLSDNILPNVISYSCVLKACGDEKSLIIQGQDLHIEVIVKGLDEHVLVGNSLVGMYAKLGFIDETEDVFGKLSVRDVVSWNSLISGFAEHGPYEQAIVCFEEMQMEGLVPNPVSYASVLKGCSSFGAISKGRELHTEIVCKGLEAISAVGNSLITMYSNFSLLPEAQLVFKNLPGQNIVTWTAIMQGYAINHNGNLAIDCFQSLRQQQVKADPVTMTCLLTACSHSSMVLEGYEFLKMMKASCGITPNEDHYSCIIDMLGRSGQLYKAENVLEMICPPSNGTWAALLSACKTHGEIELGLRCFRELMKFDSDNPTWYILMKDLYASAGRWNDAVLIEDMRKQAGFMKKRASVTIEVDKKVHEFVVGGHQTEELSTKLCSLNLRLKEEGQLANVDCVLKPSDDEERETQIHEHAERLAIAFGLLHTPEGQTLRLTKNLRMCNDCHTATKRIAQIEKREIILRDDSSIHHFKDGLCLCKDMF